jgi:type IV pilus assembly protein PilW
MSYFRGRENQRGLSLVELMIAMVLSLVLVAGTMQIYLSNKQTYRLQEAQSRVQESARFGLDFLTKDVREAGYSGCRPIEQMNVQVIAKAPIPSFSEATAITGNEATGASSWSPALPTGIAADVVDGTDTLTIQKGSSCGATLTGNLGSSNANVQVGAPNACNLSPGDAIMIADCEDAHLFRATTISAVVDGKQTIAGGIDVNTFTKFCLSYSGVSGVGGCGTGNDKLYSYDAELLKFTTVTYFIRLGAGGRNALWVFDNTKAVDPDWNPMELVEGVENMQVRYGLDTDADDIVDSYSTADAVADWSQVVSVEIRLLLETQDNNLTTASQTYTYNGATVTSPDSRLRRVFTTTVGVRNRVQ